MQVSREIPLIHAKEIYTYIIINNGANFLLLYDVWILNTKEHRYVLKQNGCMIFFNLYRNMKQLNYVNYVYLSIYLIYFYSFIKSVTWNISIFQKLSRSRQTKKICFLNSLEWMYKTKKAYFTFFVAIVFYIIRMIWE